MLCNLSREDLRALLDREPDRELLDRLRGYYEATLQRPEEDPFVTLAHKRNVWLEQDKDPVPPDTLREFVQRTHDILFEWYDRWNRLPDLVNPKFFKRPEDRADWLKENDWKVLAVWHAIRSVREYWRAAGIWNGNPYDPADRTPIVVEGLKDPPKKRKK